MYIPGAVDIGNTRIKILADGHFFVHEFNDGWKDAMHKYLWSFPGKQLLLGVSSVNPVIFAEFETEMRKRSSIKIQALSGMLPQQPFVDVTTIEGIGSDRVLGMIGALHHDPTLIKPVITIDCGTAITLNAVNVHRKCVGGAILPGISTQLRALHESTQLLPSIEAAFEDVSCGTSTTQAMRVGVVHGAAGAVRGIAENIVHREFDGQQPLVCLTGGDAGLLQRALGSWSVEPIHAPNLVMEGIAAVMAHWMERFIQQTAHNHLAA